MARSPKNPIPPEDEFEEDIIQVLLKDMTHPVDSGLLLELQEDFGRLQPSWSKEISGARGPLQVAILKHFARQSVIFC